MHAFVDPSLPRTLVGDQTRLKQILQNLVTNALRFTAAGSVHIEVAPGRLADGGSMICFSVIDTGCGIDARLQEHIFDAFVQADASTARRFGGTGLGLSIAQHLVGMMGGRISLESALGAGSTFSFTIPSRNMGVDPLSSPLRDTSVLVVENDPDLRALLRRYVEGWGMRSAAAESAAHAHAVIAAERAVKRPFDVIIVGGSIPAVDAIEFARQAYPGCVEAQSDAILIRDERADRSTESFAAYAARIFGPIRQSELFDAILRVSRGGFTKPRNRRSAACPATSPLRTAAGCRG